MDRFHVLEDAAVVLRSKGVYRQAKVYRRADGVYAAWGAGYIRLYRKGGTTAPNVSWDDIEIGAVGADDFVADAFDRLLLPPAFKQIEGGSA